MSKVLFSGCSFAKGCGLQNEELNENHYSNVLVNSVFGSNTIVKNISVGGYSNLRIFLDTATELSTSQYDYAFVGWTSYPRYVFWPGLELYSSSRTIAPVKNSQQAHNGNEISFSSEFFRDLQEKFLLVHHDHYEILDIIKYISLLLHISNNTNTKIYFINNLCSWDQDYFSPVSQPIKPEKLTDYTNKLLNSANRDDAEISALYEMMHDQYKQAGGIKPARWLNLYQNIRSIEIDKGNDGMHSGPETHLIYGNLLATQLRAVL